jgi:beta-glucosidase-like glycosyl hydrolase
VTGLQAAGVAACTKHFPGHGSTETDSHLAIATIEGGLAELRLRDLGPGDHCGRGMSSTARTVRGLLRG